MKPELSTKEGEFLMACVDLMVRSEGLKLAAMGVTVAAKIQQAAQDEAKANAQQVDVLPTIEQQRGLRPVA